MTTYTITEQQLKVLLDMCKFAYNACHSDFVMDEKIMPAISLLESLQPSKQEPLTADEVWDITASHNFEIHGDRARYIVRMTELAHNIGVKP